MNCIENMERLTLDTNMVMDLIKLYKFNGKDFYYNDVFADNRDSITKQVVEMDCFFIANILQLKITENRLKLIIKKHAVVKNRDEQLLQNVKTTLERLHANIRSFEYTVNNIHEMAKFVYRGVSEVNYSTNTEFIKNGLTANKKTVKMSLVFEEYLNTFCQKLRSKEYEVTLLITNFYVDFINMKPFKENNEIIGLFLLYILLFKEGFDVCRYTSFFQLVYNRYDTFKNSVLQANFNWQEGYSQTTPLQRMILKILLEAYYAVDDKTRDYLYDNERNKSDSIENTINKMGELFTKEELRQKHPYVSDSTINRTLQRLRDENKIRPLGVGRSAQWQKLYIMEKFDLGKQLNIFDDSFHDH